MSSYLRNVFLEFAAVFSPMAPGNMKSDFIGVQRTKLPGKAYSNRKILVRNGGPHSEAVVVAGSNAMDQREGAALSDAPDKGPKALNATAMSDVSNVAQTDNTKEILLAGDGDCVVPQNIGSTDKTDSEISHLKVLSMLHLDVIEQQQRQIQSHEREVQRLRSENETLKCRLERMNRRTHLAEKSDSPHVPNHQIGKSKLDTPLHKRKRRGDIESSISSPSKHTPKDTPTKDSKDSLNLSSSTSSQNLEPRKRQRAAEKLAKREEKAKSVGRQESKESEERYHRTDVMYPCLSDLRVPQHDPDLPEDYSVVMVPSWRTVTNQSTCLSDGYEECDDASFERRHGKLEQDERKRKRWDIQRIRELREHERLVNKQKQREYAQWDHILTTFYPDDHDAELIEVSDTIPVIAFGVQVPAVKPSEFQLPWFDAKQREKDEQRRLTRSRTSRR